MSLLEKLYGPFFDGHNWAMVITSGQDWLIILSLVLIECLLSVDNAIVLAAQTRVLPTLKEQEESLFYGIWGSYIFRFLVIGLGTYLIHFWEIKVLGSVYLMYLVYLFFSAKFSNNPVIVLIGGIIGIACMRGVAEVIMKLMRKIPELEPMAYVLIFIIAIKLFLTIPAIDIEIPSGYFGAFVLIVFVATMIIHYLRQPKRKEK